MANKLFRINRTEDEDTSTAGPATITRADDPQLLPIVPLDKDKGQPDVADPVENRIYATKEDEQEILFVTDKVTEGDFNPVTSNAVAVEFNKRDVFLVPDFAKKQALITIVTQSTISAIVPENGYILLEQFAGNINIYINNAVYSMTSADTWSHSSLTPVAKGDIVRITSSNARCAFFPIRKVPLDI